MPKYNDFELDIQNQEATQDNKHESIFCPGSRYDGVCICPIGEPCTGERL